METALSVPSAAARSRPPIRMDAPSAVLLKHFDALVTAAGSVKRFRELILHLAMQGGLSHHDSGSADTLLPEVRRARQQLSVHGARVRDVLPVEDTDAPWPLPSGWRWVRLGDLGAFLGGGTPSKANHSFWTGPLPWVSPKDMKQPYIDDAEDHISMAAVVESAAKLIPAGSILCVVRGMILAHSFPVALTRREVAINQDMKALVLAMPALGEFVLRACQAARARVLASVERSTHGTCRLDGEVVENLLIPLPPLAEQKRIVAKVDQLMALCDDLEARQTKEREIGTRLTKSALEALTTAESPAEFGIAWKRVVDNFDELLGRADSVAELRHAIRGLAFSGALVAERNSWPAATIEELSVRIVDCPHTTPAWTETGVLCLRTTNFRVGGLDLSAVRYVSPATYSERVARLTPEPGDIVYSREGGILGIACVIPPCGLVCLGQRMMLMRLDPAKCEPEFVALMLNAPPTLATVKELTGGTASPHLNVGDVRKFKVPVPSLRIQREVLGKVGHLMRICDELDTKLRCAEDRAAKLVDAAVRELVT